MFFFKKKKQVVNFDLKIPKHIAIIMDGNARWAKAKNLPTSLGHKAGCDNVRKIAEGCIDLGVKYLTIYAFSSENWNRPQDEVSYLMKLLDEYLEKETTELIQKNVRIIISGDTKRLLDSTKKKILDIENITKDNDALVLNVAFSYGSRQEIVDASKKIALAVRNGLLSVEEINEDFFKNNLYCSQIPDPDLLIRTAGDIRLSNFLLWQAAYSELYFTQTNWPDFSKENLLEAISEFNKRERRYGAR